MQRGSIPSRKYAGDGCQIALECTLPVTIFVLILFNITTFSLLAKISDHSSYSDYGSMFIFR